VKTGDTELHEIRVLEDGTICARRHDRLPMTESDWKDVQRWVETHSQTVIDALRIFGGQILSPDDREEPTQSDWAAIEAERSEWFQGRDMVWHKVVPADPIPGTVCEHEGCRGKIVDRIWPDHVDRGCIACGRTNDSGGETLNVNEDDFETERSGTPPQLSRQLDMNFSAEKCSDK
jgi:hypothetical protein